VSYINKVIGVISATVMLAAALPVEAAAPGITGGSAGTASFDLTAQDAFITQPDGQNLYSWGYGCYSQPAGFAPAGIAPPAGGCPTMQIPGPTLIVHQNDQVMITLHNKLPAAAGSTSILFPGFTVTATGGAPGVLTQEAPPSSTVTYTFKATTPGTHSYYSGTQGDLQIEMGLFGAIIVLPAGPTPTAPSTSQTTCHALAMNLPDGQSDFRLAPAAYNNYQACYDREYLFQFSEMDPGIHTQAAAQSNLACNSPQGCMTVATEPYHPAYFMINGRSMPDDMDPNYAPQYPHQPYNGNPHMHPGEMVLLRVIGTGRWQHPFHEHGNHVRILGRDGNILLSPGTVSPTTPLAGPLLFTTTTTPGLAMDGIFYWTGKGLNWDVYGHSASGGGHTYNIDPDNDPSHMSYNGKPVVCIPDTNGYYTSDPGAPNYFEWCADHNIALEQKPFGDVASGGPVTLPNPNIMANGAWFGGSPYLGPDATTRSTTPTGTTPPSGTVANPPSTEAGYAYMWHSHNEREITTNNIFPGGMMMMMLVDPQAFTINEAN
jgi:FtsP/CotA-like multicopper oxidase with cupredoxin domain